MKPLIKKINGTSPKFGKDCYVSENATIIGEVICGDKCSFWFNSVVRGDVHYIKMGNEVNIQDGAIIHCTYKKIQLILVIKLPLATMPLFTAVPLKTEY